MRTCRQSTPSCAAYKKACFLRGAHLTEPCWEPQSRDYTLRTTDHSSHHLLALSRSMGNPKWSKPTTSFERWGNLRPKTWRGFPSVKLTGASVSRWDMLCPYVDIWLPSRTGTNAKLKAWVSRHVIQWIWIYQRREEDGSSRARGVTTMGLHKATRSGRWKRSEIQVFIVILFF